MPIYYPMVATRLNVRFDESLLSGQTPAPTTPEGNAKGGGGASINPLPQPELAKGVGDRLSQSLIIIPTMANIELPAVRQAPKFSMTYAWRDFPVDPRAIRAMEVEIFIGVIDGSNFARGMLREMNGDRTLASQLEINRANLMLVGTVDNITTTFAEKGSEVSLEGRGLQGLLLDAKIHADQLKALKDAPVNEVVQQLLRMDSHGKTIADFVRIDVNEWPGKLVPKPADPSILIRENKGQDGNKSNLPMKSDPNSVAVWDVITNLCSLVGAVPYFITNELWIRPAKSIFDQKKAGDKDNAGIPNDGKTPFKGGKQRHIELGNGSIDVSFRKMVYGRNLLNFKLARKFGGVKTPTVKVISMNTGKRGKAALLIAEWPPDGQLKARTSSVSADGKTAHTEPLVIYKPGITDKTRLSLIAEQIFNEVGRGELGGSGSTKDLASLGGDNEDADIIRLRPGDAVEFAADASGLASIPPVVSELNNQAATSPDTFSKALQAKGYDKDLADVLTATASGRFSGLQNVFRIANVKYAWAIESGIAVDFDFQNYVAARYDFTSKGSPSELKDVTATKTSKTGSPSVTKHPTVKAEG